MEPSTQRVQRHREMLRAAGSRPIQIWVPDTRRADFVEECRKQSLLVAEHEKHNTEFSEFMDAALEEVEGWQGQGESLG